MVLKIKRRVEIWSHIWVCRLYTRHPLVEQDGTLMVNISLPTKPKQALRCIVCFDQFDQSVCFNQSNRASSGEHWVELRKTYSPLLFDAAANFGVECKWLSSTERLIGESGVRQVWWGGSGSGGSVELLVELSRGWGISGRGMSGALRIRSREPSCLSRAPSFLGFMNLAKAFAPTQWLFLWQTHSHSSTDFKKKM